MAIQQYVSISRYMSGDYKLGNVECNKVQMYSKSNFQTTIQLGLIKELVKKKSIRLNLAHSHMFIRLDRSVIFR